MKRPSKGVLTLLKIAVSAGLLAWIVSGADLDSIFASIASANVGLLVFAFVMFYLGYLITACRWRILLRAQGVQASIPYLLQSFMVAMFFNNFLPSTIGGDVVRMYDSYRAGGSKTGAVSVIVVDRFFGMFALLTYALVAVLVAGDVRDQVPLLPLWVGLGMAGIATFAWIVFASPAWVTRRVQAATAGRLAPVARILAKLLDALKGFQGRRDVLLKALGLSFLLQLNVIVHFIVLTVALGIELPPLAMFIIIPLAAVIMMLPISINAIGVREAVFVFLYGLFGVPREQALALAWVSFGFVLIQGLIGGIVFAFRSNKIPRGESA